MSYEGYSRFICKNGHLWNIDAHLLMYDEDKQLCPKCGEPEVWENSVDLTNGSFDDEENRIDGFIELKVKKEISGICSECGEKHICERLYEIPKLLHDALNVEGEVKG